MKNPPGSKILKRHGLLYKKLKGFWYRMTLSAYVSTPRRGEYLSKLK